MNEVQKEEELRSQLKIARKNYIAQHPELDKRTKVYILNGHTEPGMNKEQVKVCWGEPERVESTAKYGADEVWTCYRHDLASKSTYHFYFKDGILIKEEGY